MGRGARVFGAVCCALLALLSLLWIGRDVGVAASLPDLWWSWAGSPDAVPENHWGTSLYDPVLVGVYAVAGVTALHATAAAGALATAGAATILLRAPALWTLTADWMQGVDQDLRNRALLSAGVAVTLGAVLLISVAAGRRPSEATGAGYLLPDEQPPRRPARGAAATGMVFLAAAAVAFAAWELREAARTGWEAYGHRLTGEYTSWALLQPPLAYGKWATAAMCFAAAVAAARRAPLSRPLGMTAGAFVLGWGAADTSRYLKDEVFENFGALGAEHQLQASTGIGLLLAGFVILFALAGRGERDPVAEPLSRWQEPSSQPPW
ncbi:hypothetical protein AA958_23190 [Streptomyces sp. CNQ-509]|uniref:hypothetical protein n=1 Tax=unclassified Streptomyces TaxID=2593676 RepID=UPI00062DE108|nr:hypothetical protein [Streptomyces sp. CNQ-509]AKH84625.1 hypothetical protein AA958_23190 [Streptomyces sp. CNQ-509]